MKNTHMPVNLRFCQKDESVTLGESCGSSIQKLARLAMPRLYASSPRPRPSRPPSVSAVNVGMFLADIIIPL